MGPARRQIEPRALELGNNRLYRKIQGEDLVARQANFHQSCRKSFYLKYVNHQRNKTKTISNDRGDEKQNDRAAAREKALSVVVDFIKSTVVGRKTFVKLATLRLMYVEELEKSGFPSPEYRSEKLRTRIENHDISEVDRLF